MREILRDIIDRHRFDPGWFRCTCGWGEGDDATFNLHPGHVLDMLDTALTVTMREHLAELPVDSVVEDAKGYVAQQVAPGEWLYAKDTVRRPGLLIRLPAVLLRYGPGERTTINHRKETP